MPEGAGPGEASGQAQRSESDDALDPPSPLQRQSGVEQGPGTNLLVLLRAISQQHTFGLHVTVEHTLQG